MLLGNAALHRTRMSSLSGLGRVDWVRVRGLGSSPEHAHSSASGGAKDVESLTAISSSEAPKETKLLTADEGRCSSCVKNTSKTRRCGESEARGGWAGVMSLEPEGWVLLLHCSLLLGEKGNGGVGWGGPPSWNKAIHERWWERLMSPQWEHEVSVSTASAWALPRQATHSLCPSTSCRDSLHEHHDIWNNATVEITQEMLWRTPVAPEEGSQLLPMPGAPSTAMAGWASFFLFLLQLLLQSQRIDYSRHWRRTFWWYGALSWLI